jgi:aromatic amino acid aminotransferase I / 2-aminoadipate transaminase
MIRALFFCDSHDDSFHQGTFLSNRYYALQFSAYQLGHLNGVNHIDNQTIPEFLQSLSPSYLAFDTQGRVIRLETFSKTLAPGLRTGYIIANPLFSERLLRVTEVVSQAPSGFSMTVLAELLSSWGQDGYLKWLSNLRQQYRIRRDWMIDAINAVCDLVPAETAGVPGSDDLVACLRSPDGRVPVFSFNPPMSGMFIWCKFHLSDNATFQQLAADPSVEDPEEAFMARLWTALANAKCLVTPGNYYTPFQGADKRTTKARGAAPGVGYHRLAFSMTSKEEMEEAIVRMERVLRAEWGL